jgi:hypothetical protein
MLESNGIRMKLDGEYPRLDAVNEILGSTKKWDYVVIDAWHLGREQVEKDPARASMPPRFPIAVSAFVKEVRAHSPGCKIILFPWWIPRGPKVTNEGAMEAFRSCVEQAKANRIWVATTGPAFMEARLERPDLKITKSKTDLVVQGFPEDLDKCIVVDTRIDFPGFQLLVDLDEQSGSLFRHYLEIEFT